MDTDHHAPTTLGGSMSRLRNRPCGSLRLSPYYGPTRRHRRRSERSFLVWRRMFGPRVASDMHRFKTGLVAVLRCVPDEQSTQGTSLRNGASHPRRLPTFSRFIRNNLRRLELSWIENIARVNAGSDIGLVGNIGLPRLGPGVAVSGASDSKGALLHGISFCMRRRQLSLGVL